MSTSMHIHNGMPTPRCALCDTTLGSMTFYAALPDGLNRAAGDVCLHCFSLLESALQTEQDHNPDSDESTRAYDEAHRKVETAMQQGQRSREARTCRKCGKDDKHGVFENGLCFLCDDHNYELRMNAEEAIREDEEIQKEQEGS